MYQLIVFLLGVVELALARSPVGQNLIFILVDGYGAQLLNTTKPDSTFGVRHLATNGVQVDYVTPSFPTQTWPQWMSLATGLYTENHGFTADYMWDPKTNFTFERGTGPNDNEDVWWDNARAPFWYTAGKAGVDVNCYWFAHCHRSFYDMVVQVPQRRWANLDDPHQTENFHEIFPEVINKIKKYQNYRQQMFLIRYGDIAVAQKKYEPGSEEIESAVVKFDLYINELQQLLEDNDLFASTNLIVMSDHGYAPVKKEDEYLMELCLPDFSIVNKIVNTPSMTMVYSDPTSNVHYEFHVCEVWMPMGDYDTNDSPNVKTYNVEEIPEDLHWKNSKHMSGTVLITKPGVRLITKDLPSVPSAKSQNTGQKQASGWDPALDEMKAIFVARGPAFRKNERFGPIETVDVYQMILNILSLEPSHGHNGTWANVENMLTDGWEERGATEKASTSFSSFYVLCFYIPVLLLSLYSYLV